MPRRDDIGTAFRAALMRNPKGYLWLRTEDFIRELAVKNWHFTYFLNWAGDDDNPII